jgi:hypothetical protein
MSHRSTLIRLAIASVATALVVAAPAAAMPIDPQGTALKDARQKDMHASTVQAPDGAAKTAVKDARGEASAAAGGTTTENAVKDARGEAAAGGGTGGGKAGGPVREPGFQGPPTWPMYPTPLPKPAQQPVVATDGGDDIGIDVPVALLILAGALALGGGMAVAGMKARAHTRPAH